MLYSSWFFTCCQGVRNFDEARSQLANLCHEFNILLYSIICFWVRPKGCPIIVHKVVPRKVPRELDLVELPQTRTEVVAVNAHADPQFLVHLIEKLWESVHLPFHEEEDVEGVQIRRSVLAGERLELRDPVANRVRYGMREESEDMCVDTGR